MILWDEALKFLPQDSLVQVWHSAKITQAATLQKHKIIVSPTNPWYLDYPNFPWKLKSVYAYDPTEGLKPEEEKWVIGGEGCLWGEFTPEPKIVPKLFPRLFAIAEVLWSPRGKRNWEDFKKRAQRTHQEIKKQSHLPKEV
jgi:hexosaminidase